MEEERTEKGKGGREGRKKKRGEGEIDLYSTFSTTVEKGELKSSSTIF